MRERLEDRLAAAYDELAVTTFHGFCARLLHDEALEAGLDPFATPVSASDRLAMLLERIDELPLRHHDLRGNPSATLGAIVQRIDRLKDELVSAADYAAWAADLPEERAREREFAALYATHERMLAEAGTLDVGDLVLHALPPPAHEGERARAARAPPPARAGRRAPGRELRAGPAAAAAGGRARQHQRGRRRRPGDPPLPRRRDQERARLPRRVAGGDGRAARASRYRSGEQILRAARAVVEPAPDRIEKELHGEPGGAVAFWRCASERAQAQAVAAEVERLIAREDVAPEDVCVLVRSVRGEGQAVAVAFEERAVPYRLSGAAAFFQRAEVRDLLAWLRLLVDPGDAGAVVRALARPPVELRAIDLARVTQIARRRKLDMVAALGAALESPQIPPEARERITHFLSCTARPRARDRLDAPRPLRAPADRAARAAPPAAVRRLDRGRRAAAEPRPLRRAGGRLRAPLAAGHGARLRALDRRRRRGRAARGGGGVGERPHGVRVMTMHAAKGLEFDHVYVLGLMAARMPGPRRRALEPIPEALIKEAVPPDSKAAHVAEMRRLLHVAMTRARRRLVLAFPERSERGALQQPSPFAEEARAAVGAEWEQREEELFGPAETLQSTFRMLRDELLTTVAQVGGRLGELRFDTDLDVSHAVVRYLELLKLAALLERTRAGEQEVGDVLPEINARLLQAVDRRAARDLRDVGARRVPARRRARREARARAPSRSAPSRRSSRSSRAAATG